MTGEEKQLQTQAGNFDFLRNTNLSYAHSEPFKIKHYGELEIRNYIKEWSVNITWVFLCI